MPHSALVEGFFQLSIVLVGNKISDSLAEVPQKTIALLSTFHDAACQHREPGNSVVATQLFELGEHVVSPVLRSGFPTVVDDILDAFLSHLICADCFFVAVEVLFEVILNKAPIELVDFESGGFRSSRVIRYAKQGIPDTQN